MNTDDGYITDDGRKIGGVVMEMKNITLRFGGVTAIKDITFDIKEGEIRAIICLLYTSPSPRDAHESRMPSSVTYPSSVFKIHLLLSSYICSLVCHCIFDF